jgi:hypothetical protein
MHAEPRRRWPRASRKAGRPRISGWCVDPECLGVGPDEFSETARHMFREAPVMKAITSARKILTSLKRQRRNLRWRFRLVGDHRACRGNTFPGTVQQTELLPSLLSSGPGPNRATVPRSKANALQPDASARTARVRRRFCLVERRYFLHSWQAGKKKSTSFHFSLASGSRCLNTFPYGLGLPTNARAHHRPSCAPEEHEPR